MLHILIYYLVFIYCCFRHGRRSLDVTLSVQFAALPNLAKLELVRLSKSRAESSVVIALQSAEGSRVQGEFMPSETLWSILENLGARQVV